MHDIRYNMIKSMSKSMYVLYSCRIHDQKVGSFYNADFDEIMKPPAYKICAKLMIFMNS